MPTRLQLAQAVASGTTGHRVAKLLPVNVTPERSKIADNTMVRLIAPSLPHAIHIQPQHAQVKDG
jgi:hypothetical protein